MGGSTWGLGIEALDDAALLWLHQFMFRWPLLDRFGGWLLDSYLVKFGPLTAAVCWLWFRAGSALDAVRTRLLDALTAGLGGLVLGRALALWLPFRERPLSRPELHFTIPFGFDMRTWSAFPSDHAVMAFALALSLLRISRPLGVWACLHAALVVCLPRVYFGLHHPSDVVAGVLLAAVLAFLVPRLPVCQAANRALLRAERNHAGAFYAAGFLLLYQITEMFASLRVVAIGAFRVLRHVAG